MNKKWAAKIMALSVALAVLLPAEAGVWASSMAVSTGNSSIDGRPVAFKNRDHWSSPDGWQVYPYYFTADSSSFGSGDRYTARFSYMGVTANGDSGKDSVTNTTIPWAGSNDKGLGLVQVAGHTLSSEFATDHGYSVSQDLTNGMSGGYLNHVILSRAETVDEVEQILRDTNNGGGFHSSFARNTSAMISVFDRNGNAAVFEFDGDSFTRDNITQEYQQDANGYYTAAHNDDKDTANPADGAYSGYDWRNNFSKVNWSKPNGFPYFYDQQTTTILTETDPYSQEEDSNVVNTVYTPDGIHDWEFSTSAVKRHTRTGIRLDDPYKKDYRYFIHKNVGSNALGTDNYLETLSKNIGELPGSQKPTGWHINRFVSTFGTVLVGNKIGDPYGGKLTTMWVNLGEPTVGIFIPLFPYTGTVPAELNDMYLAINAKRHLVYNYTDDNAVGYSGGRNADHTIDTVALVGSTSNYYAEGGIQNYTFDIENWAFDEYDKFMTDLRSGTRTDAQLKSDMIAWQQNMATKMKTHYIAGTSPNVALKKAVTVDSTYSTYAAAKAVDGVVADESRWISANTAGPHWLEINLGQSYTLKNAEITTGKGTNEAVSNFKLQSWNGTAWVDIPGTSVTGNTSTKVVQTFTPVATSKIRFYSTDNGYVKVKDIRLFE
ncbi:discoidin domain-containing protein [Paenibacillus radicis (ex Xue et al. 2023)]|uniref:Discoidin domain-containing protein n=1 Tax=Paenibacillus radicis (ex Xue et al. 2023) TaxID=2972489 RepID=A0ABT1YR54_9BACL|nr:discoidin domain-containing protein [Paenibacillus radicis (ex Xue et al. 2023)]MCR8635664.1 discoidin domain-containing protein [Paenibacillus radicis (ex Xue et al. 2023)]